MKACYNTSGNLLVRYLIWTATHTHTKEEQCKYSIQILQMLLTLEHNQSSL